MTDADVMKLIDELWAERRTVSRQQDEILGLERENDELRARATELEEMRATVAEAVRG